MLQCSRVLAVLSTCRLAVCGAVAVASTGCGGLADSNAGTSNAEGGASDGAASLDSETRDGAAGDAGGEFVGEGVMHDGTDTLAAGQSEPSAIAVDSANVYWADIGKGAVMKVGLCGGTPSTLSPIGASPTSLAVDSTDAYWTNSIQGAIVRAPLRGGESSTLIRGQFGRAFAVGSRNLYWSTIDGLMTMPLAGSSATTLVSATKECPHPLNPPGECIYPQGMVGDATHLYWSNAGENASVMSVPLGGGSPVTLASEQDSPGAVALDATSVYWVDWGWKDVVPPSWDHHGPNTGSVMKVPLRGGTPVTLASGVSPCGLAVDTMSAYWTDFAPRWPNGRIMKVPLVGGTPTTVVRAESEPMACPIAVDTTSIYWGTVGVSSHVGIVMFNGALMRTALK